ncbi:MFS transporter [Aureimonas fodinaquatilis]|uniref:MFS transporter n=1 Tax=Aureimonas fodinaquatilis TaxID=2565783 RepID=A0A5B0DVF9_9HYPH|nr:MFS transporter [Aureimonas fodinaquatilis]KAA0970383.1 MFS transporter [Aureimonas fodinaquatilis]
MFLQSRWLVLAIVSSALLLIVIDMTVLYTALPRLTADLSASASQKLWIVNAYALVVAGLLPGSGALSDRYGAKVMFVSGLVVFGAASMLAAFSPSSEILILARVFLAIGAAMMMPATLSIIRQQFDDPQERAFAIGVWASIAAGGAAFGPVLGGILLEFFWWGSVFLINVPVVVIAFVAAIRLIPRNPANPNRPFDLVGSGQVLVGLVALVLAIKELGRADAVWSLAFLYLALSGSFLGLFYRRQRRASSPMVDFALFKNKEFSSGVIAALVACAALIGLELAISQRLQLAMALSPLQAGIAILPLPLAAFVAGPLAGLVMPRMGATRLLWSSMMVAGAGTLGLFFALDHGVLAQIAAFIVIGVGVGATMTAASSAILMNAPAESAGSAASIEEVSYEMGGAIGVAILGSAMAGIYTNAMSSSDVANAHPQIIDSFDAALAARATMPEEAATAMMDLALHAFNMSAMAAIAIAASLLLVSSAFILYRSRPAVM